MREEGEGGVHRSSGSANVHVSCHLPTQSSGHKNSHATRRNLHILGVRVGGRPAIRSECVIGAEAARRRAVRRKQPRLKGRRRRGKDGYQHQIAKKPRGAHRLQAPAHRSGPPSLRSPRTRSSNPGAAPRPPRSRSQPPAGSGNPLQPSPGAQSGPAGPRGLPERSGGATPRPVSHHLPPEPRFDLNPPATPHAHAGPGPPAGPTRTPGPADNEQPQLTSSARAPWVRGRFLSPFSCPFSSDQERYPAAGRQAPRPPLAAPRPAASAGPPAALPPRGKSLYPPLQHGCSPRRRCSRRLAATPRRRRAAADRAQEPPAGRPAVPRAARVASPQQGRAAGVRGEEATRAGLCVSTAD